MPSFEKKNVVTRKKNKLAFFKAQKRCYCVVICDVSYFLVSIAKEGELRREEFFRCPRRGPRVGCFFFFFNDFFVDEFTSFPTALTLTALSNILKQLEPSKYSPQLHKTINHPPNTYLQQQKTQLRSHQQHVHPNRRILCSPTSTHYRSPKR